MSSSEIQLSVWTCRIVTCLGQQQSKQDTAYAVDTWHRLEAACMLSIHRGTRPGMSEKRLDDTGSVPHLFGDVAEPVPTRSDADDDDDDADDDGVDDAEPRRCACCCCCCCC